MSLLKIAFVTPNQKIVIYSQEMRQLWRVEEHLRNVLSKQNVQMVNPRIYWIDDEGDQIEMLNEDDYDVFLKCISSSRTPEIYFEPKVKPPELNPENMIVHKGVGCDICQMSPIVGIRYKCLECNDYDICMKCEREMKHTEHLMVRISTKSLSYRNVQYKE